ncbi:hypothetical protein [Sorangium sp. So ce1097]|uniref:hypothetical protein n=1 Tax=Sorangium sp. So ce1097 TaxID=3133330 RepID=UPI003F5E8CB7
MPMMNPGSRTYAHRLCAGACLALLAVTVGCGGAVIAEDDTGPVGGEDDTGTPVGQDEPGTPVGQDEPGTPVGQDDTGTTPPADPGDPGVWPKTVTLAVQGIGEAGEHVRLSDGTVSDAGDLGVQLSRLVALRSAAADSICEMGMSYAALADIPIDVAGCSWSPVAYLSATSIHESDESYRIGLGLLVWDAERATLYRLRVLGDSYDVTGASTATFEYEPVR